MLNSSMTDGIKFRTRRLHEFSLDTPGHSFFLHKLCDSTAGKMVYFMADTDNGVIDDRVRIKFATFNFQIFCL